MTQDQVEMILEVIGAVGVVCSVLAPLFKPGSAAEHYLSLLGANLRRLKRGP